MRHCAYDQPQPIGPGIGCESRREFLAILPARLAMAGWILHAPPLARPLVPACHRSSSTQLVYVVDDTPEVVAMYRLLLEDAGYEVRTFDDRAKAVTAFLTADPRPALLITDYVGYPFSAERLMRECRQAQPTLRILMVTGWPVSCLSFDGVQPNRLLQKPFDIAQLIDEVRALTRVTESRTNM